MKPYWGVEVVDVHRRRKRIEVARRKMMLVERMKKISDEIKAKGSQK